MVRIDLTNEQMKDFYQKENNAIVIELSDIDTPAGGRMPVTVTNVDTGNSKVFSFTHIDTDGEDIYGWNYIATDKSGLVLLLIND